MSIERQLLRQLRRTMELSELSAGLEVVRQRAWASALFVGTRFTIGCTVDDDGDRFEQWLADLPDLELPLRGHFMASADVTERRAGAAVIDLLVIEES